VITVVSRTMGSGLSGRGAEGGDTKRGAAPREQIMAK